METFRSKTVGFVLAGYVKYEYRFSKETVILQQFRWAIGLKP
jgi:hypothetical protein